MMKIKKFQNESVHGTLLSIVNLGKWTLMHNKNDILLVHLFLLFSLMMRAGFQISFWFSLFITKIDICIKENNLNLGWKNTYCYMNYYFLIYVFYLFE